MKTVRKGLAILLSLLMLLSVLPLSAFAEELHEAAAQTEEAPTKPAPAEDAAQDPDAEPRQGAMIAAEITVGNVKSTYAVDETGKLVLVGEETIAKRGLFKAPKNADSTWAAFSDDALKAAATTMMSSAIGTTAIVTDETGHAEVIFGASGFGSFKDENHDLICDDCGYCLNGCTDGKVKRYTEDDIADKHPDPEGKYYNSEGVWVGTDAKGTYTYTQVDENGNTIYEEDGVTPKTVVIEYDYIQYETYVDGADGTCDVCGKAICKAADGTYGHDFSDGRCDGCGACMGVHVDHKGKTLDKPDGECDTCGKEPHTFVDENNDSKCDTCGLDSTHTCADKKGNTEEVGDGKCDTCGYCMEDCVDSKQSDGTDGADGVCDNCGKAFLVSCAHVDRTGSQTCSNCGSAPAACGHLTLSALQQPAAQLAAIAAELIKRDNDEANPKDYRDWLSTTLKPYYTASEDGTGTGLGDEIAKRNEMQHVSTTDAAFVSFCESVLATEAADVTTQSLVGTLRNTDSGPVLNEEGSLFTQLQAQLEAYEAANDDTKYAAAKAYFVSYANRAQTVATCEAKLITLAGERFDAALTALYGSSTPQKISVTANNRNEVKNKLRALEAEEALLLKLYGTAYTDQSYTDTANSIWNNNAQPTMDAQGRRCVGFAMLANVQFAINELKEAAFTNYEQITYDTKTDADGKHYYAKRPGRADDLLRDPANAADTFTVYDETIRAVIAKIDGYIASPEAVALIAKLLPESFGVEVRDYNNDGKTAMSDLLMSVLMQKVLSDDLINRIFAMIYPTVTELGQTVSDLFDDISLVEKMGGGRYRINLLKVLFKLFDAESSYSDTLNDVLDALSIGGTFDFYLNGGKAKTFKTLLTDAGFSFWPSQVAALLEQADSEKYSDIIATLKNCPGDLWRYAVDSEGNLNFQWHMESFDDFKQVLSVIFSSLAPVLEMLFAGSLNQYKSLDLSNATYISMLVSAILVQVPLSTDAGIQLDFDAFHFYEDVVVPIFEAFGINDFVLSDGTEAPGYEFQTITFSSTNTVDNVRQVVDGIVDPLMVLVQQFVSHPIEKLLSVLPNLALMLENSALLELFDLDVVYDMYVKADFHMTTGSFFDGLADIIENQIMKHWYDWLNPVKYAQLLITTLAYAGLQTLLGAVMQIFSHIPLNVIATFFSLDLSDTISGMVGDMLVPTVRDLFQKLAAMLDGKIPDASLFKDWPKNVKMDLKNIFGSMNPYVFIDAFFTSSAAKQALGFDLGKISSVLKWFFDHLQDQNGNPLKYFNTNLINLEELSSLGTLQKNSGSIREAKYKQHWNSLQNGEYYFVSADISDVFYHVLSMVTGVLKDKTTLETVLRLFDTDYDTLKTALASVAADGLETLDLGLTLSDILKDATDENGKLDLDKIMANLTTDNLLLVICEALNPTNDYDAGTLSYPETPAATASEISAHDDTIPYLEYDNDWTQKMASFVVDDIDDFADAVLQELPYDLNPDTPEIETIRAYAKPLLLKYLNEPAYITLITELLSGVYTEDLALPADLIKDATGIDISVWKNDFAYLFDEDANEPQTTVFPLLRGTRTGTDDSGKPLVNWTYDGEPVETYSDIFAALGYLLTPAQPVLDMVFSGKDFHVLPYDKDGATQSVVTVKGHDGYNFAMLPLLEAMGIDKSKLLSSEEFQAKGTAQGLLYCVDQIVNRLFAIFDSDTMLAELFEMLAQLMFAVSDNGVGVLLKNLLHPLWVLLDTLRPIVNVDLDTLLNTLICRFTYKLGGYSSEAEMRRVMETRGAAFKLKTLNLESLLKLVSVIASVQADGNRYFLELKEPYQAAMQDLAYLRESFSSKAYALDDSGNRIAHKAYRLNTEGKDALTCMLSMGLDILMYGNNADVLDAFIQLLLGQKGLAKTAIELMKGLPAEYATDFDWAYILGKDATAEQKAALLVQIKNGEIAADDYRTAQAQKDFDKYLKSYDLTDWDEETAVHLAERLDDMITNALNIDTGDGKLLATVLLEKLGVNETSEHYTLGILAKMLANGLLTDETIDKLLGLLSDFLNGMENDAFTRIAEAINHASPEDAEKMIDQTRAKVAQFKKAIEKLASMVGIDLAAFNIDSSRTEYKSNKVVYYNADGEPTGLERPLVKKDLANIEDVLFALLKPVMPLLSFVLLGNNLSLFNASGVTEARSRRDDQINVTGIESYRYALLPLLEALGVEGLKPAADYISGRDYNIEGLMQDLLTSVFNGVRGLLNKDDGGKVLDGLLNLLPDLLYFINANALGVSAQNLTAQITAVLDFYNSYAGKTGDDALTLPGLIKQFTGLDVDLTKIALTDLLSLVSAKDADGNYQPLVLSAFAKRLLDNFTTGRIYYNAASACDFDTYRMTYRDSRDKAATVTILISFALDQLEDPANDGFWKTIVGEPVHQTLINIFNLNDFKFDYQDPTWLFTEYADKDILVSALTLSKLFDLDPYAGKKWTREMAAELADNLEQFIEDMLYLLGLEINGIQIRNLRELMHALIGGMLFSDDMLNRLTGLLGKIKPLLDKYDPDGAIAGFIQRLTGIDLHAWDAYAPGGIYENGRDWGFSAEATEAAVDANGAVFEQALVELLAPVAPAMAWLLADSDYTFFAEGDGLGKNAEPIQITLPGAEGYKYALVPLFEALNIDGSPKNLVQNLRDGDICDPADYTENVKQDVSYAVTGVVHPLVAMVQKLMDSTATQLLELLPSIVYFINCNGIDTVVKNLIHAVLIIANAAEPMKTQISALVYDENGFDLYRTLNLEKIVKESVYTLAGVTEEDVKEIYEQCGGIWRTVDGLEDVDFRLLFSIGLAAVNNMLAKAGVPFKFTSIAALAVNELTHGYVRSFDSLTGKTAYTMVLDKEIDRYCYGDLLSILIRIVLKFLSVDNNTDALVALIKTKANIGGVGEAAISAFLHLLAGYMGTLGGFEVAMLSIYYTVYGASRASGSGVEAYDHVNDKLGRVVAHLTSLDNDIARAVLQVLIAEGDEQIGDIVGSQGVAGNGLIRFFKQIYDWFLRIINFFKNLFR